MREPQAQRDLLTDARAKVLILAFMSVAHLVTVPRMRWGVMATVAVIALLQRATLWRTRRMLGLAFLLVGVVCVAVACFAPPAEARDVALELARLLSLAVATVVLALSISILELAAALRRFRLPGGVVLALAIGMRFLPVIGEELERTALVRRQRGVTLRGMLRRYGLMGGLSRALSPIIVATIRRVEAVVLAVHIRGLRQRIETHRFRASGTLDKVVVAVAALVLVMTIIERLTF